MSIEKDDKKNQMIIENQFEKFERDTLDEPITETLVRNNKLICHII